MKECSICILRYMANYAVIRIHAPFTGNNIVWHLDAVAAASGRIGEKQNESRRRMQAYVLCQGLWERMK